MRKPSKSSALIFAALLMTIASLSSLLAQDASKASKPASDAAPAGEKVGTPKTEAPKDVKEGSSKPKKKFEIAEGDLVYLARMTGLK